MKYFEADTIIAEHLGFKVKIESQSNFVYSEEYDDVFEKIIPRSHAYHKSLNKLAPVWEMLNLDVSFSSEKGLYYCTVEHSYTFVYCAKGKSYAEAAAIATAKAIIEFRREHDIR